MKSEIKLIQIETIRFGIEIEVEFPHSKDSQKLMDRHKIIPGWMMDGDCSLENGVEYRPTAKNKLYWNEESLTQLKEVLALIRVHRGRVSKNCGLHIHIDCTNFTDAQVHMLISEWVHKQRYVVKRFGVHPDRLGDTCKLLPAKDLKKLKVKDIHTYRKSTSAWGFGYGYLGEKYYSLNASHLCKGDYGTVEFRLFDGTLSFAKLKEQIYFTLNFIKDCIERE